MDESFDFIARIIPATDTIFITPSSSGGGGAYVGPGDVISGAAFWFGLRAYSSASIGSNAIDILRASDSTTNTFKTVAGGGLDMAAITTFLASTTGIVTKLYDQTGNGFDAGLDGAPGPAFTFSGIGSLPCITSAATNVGFFPATRFTNTQPFTSSCVVKRTGNFTTRQQILIDYVNLVSGFENVADTWVIGNVAATATATDNNLHAIQSTWNGSSSQICVDGSNTSGLTVSGATAWANAFIGIMDGPAKPTGLWAECGVWNINFSGAQLTAMNSNQHTYWGF